VLPPPGLGAAPAVSSTITETVDLKTNVNVVVGKGGDMIKKIQMESGAKLDITKVSSYIT
jgi:hypothetical protein